MGSTVETKAKIIFDVDNRARQALQKAGNQIETLQRKTKNLSSTFTTMRNAGAIAFGAISTGIGFAVSEASKIQDLEVSFTTMLGSVDKAKESIKGLRDFSASTPFQFDGIAQSARQLLAFGVTADDMQEKLKFLGDIASGAGVPLKDMAAIFGKAKAKGKAMTEELLQMSDRGVPIIKVLGDRLGKTGEQIFKMASEGEISFDILEGALKSMSEEGGIFFDLMNKRSETLSGRFSTLKDNIINASVPLGNAFLPILQDTSEKLIPIVESVGKWIEVNPELTKTILLAVGAFAGFVTVLGTIGLIMPKVIAGIGLIGKAFIVAHTKGVFAVGGLNALTFTGVLASIAIVAGALTGLILLLNQTVKAFQGLKSDRDKLITSTQGLVDLEKVVLERAGIAEEEGRIVASKRLTEVARQATEPFIETGESVFSQIGGGDPLGVTTPQVINFDFKGANITNKEEFMQDIKMELGRGFQLKELGI